MKLDHNSTDIDNMKAFHDALMHGRGLLFSVFASSTSRDGKVKQIGFDGMGNCVLKHDGISIRSSIQPMSILEDYLEL